MSGMKLAARIALVLSVVLMFGVAGCGGSKTGGGGGGGGRSSTKARTISEADQARLDEARKAAVDAETKLSDLRLERMELEKAGGGH